AVRGRRPCADRRGGPVRRAPGVRAGYAGGDRADQGRPAQASPHRDADEDRGESRRLPRAPPGEREDEGRRRRPPAGPRRPLARWPCLLPGRADDGSGARGADRRARPREGAPPHARGGTARADRRGRRARGAAHTSGDLRRDRVAEGDPRREEGRDGAGDRDAREGRGRGAGRAPGLSRPAGQGAPEVAPRSAHARAARAVVAPLYTQSMAQAPALVGGFELPAGPRLPRIGFVDAVALEARAAPLPKRSVERASKVQALELAVRMMDLTTLEGQDTPGKIAALCSKALRPDPSDLSVPSVAAVCVYPSLVGIAKERLGGSGVKVAS